MNAHPKKPQSKAPAPAKPVEPRKYRYDSPEQEAVAKEILAKHAEVLTRLAK